MKRFDVCLYASYLSIEVFFRMSTLVFVMQSIHNFLKFHVFDMFLLP